MMNLSWVLVCAVLFSLSSACRDAETCLQVPIPPYFQGQVLQEPHMSMMQRELDLTELLNVGDSLQKEVIIPPPWQKEPSASELKPRPRSRPFRPRAFPPALSYPVQFPLGQPTLDNIQAICNHSDHRPRYPHSYFPPSGFSKQKRMAAAVNNAESWFRTCCKLNQTRGTEEQLCCATQAWQHSVTLFCEEDLSVKDRIYECCRRTGINRLTCFSGDTPNPSYKPTEELPVEEIGSAENFSFNRNECPRNVMSPVSVRANKENRELNPITSQKLDISFPPGMPTTGNIESLCGNQRFRPLYTTKCLPRSGYELLARQVKTINRLEKRFKLCCKKKNGALNCAEQKWRDELTRYCSASSGGLGEIQCCQADDQYGCFQSISSDPLYDTSAKEEPTLNKICDTPMVNKRFPVGFQLKTQCCPLPEQNRNTCFVQNLEQISQSLCSTSKPTTPAVHRCCKMTSGEEITQCFNKNVMEAVAKANKKGLKKKKKICPIP